ncbi:ketopantoate reductase family protein [Caproicibacter fermentans]|uniref:2-dehydropantoate 2-reductase n=1 Tax=Caproicibacter fermentans TaxID=2576756 RepID=A0A7G8T9L6_9FIRM|nr:2-dehydropantoate 2-reductase [Caproicibacter fermentans]QNK40307.1 2-dehydropantoate 2-reductase [Caproicibacter fermentans]
MKVAIIGAGAMGSLYGVYLASRHEVTLLDSYRPQVDAINQNGLTKVEKDDGETNVRVKAVPSGSGIGVQELVIVFVKSIHTKDAMQENRGLIGPDTIVMTLQNGAGNNRDIAAFVPRERIVVGTSSHNSVTVGPAKIFHSGCGPTNIGPEKPGEEGGRAVEKAAQALRACGLEVNVMENIQKILWSKLFVNCGVNALSALMQCKIGEVAGNPTLWKICTRIVYECVLVAEADGTYFDRKEALENVKKIILADADGYASMYQDRQHQRRTEIDKINGVVAGLAAEYGLDAPYNRMLVDLIHGVEQSW